MTAEEIREGTLSRLRGLGFRPAPSLPLPDVSRDLRPVSEITARLLALDSVFTWVAYPRSEVPDERVIRYMDRNSLRDWMTASERQMVALPRPEARERFIDLVGWRLENMWPLAWILGFHIEPPVSGVMIDFESVTRPMLNEFMRLGRTIGEQVEKSAPRSRQQVIELEDCFYCAHNASRSARLGAAGALAGRSHGVAEGGVIHERRHALTWCLSPGVDWEDTDLNT